MHHGGSKKFRRFKTLGKSRRLKNFDVKTTEGAEAVRLLLKIEYKSAKSSNHTAYTMHSHDQ